MDQLAAMRVFVAVTEAGGFTAAARKMRMPLPTVCRKVAELEDHLGARLLVRTTRRVAPTDGGRRYYQDVKRLLEDIEASDRQAAEEHLRPKGLLTITAPATFGHFHILPIVDDFMRRHEEIETRLVFTNQLLDLIEEHVDLAVRIGRTTGDTAGVLEAGTMRQFVCASRDYLDEKGRPADPHDLLSHDCITFSRQSNPVPWAFCTRARRMLEVAVRPKICLNTAEAAADAAIRGCGLTQLYAYQGAHHVAAGTLEIVLKPFEVEPVPVSLVIPQYRRVPQKVRAFVDFAQPTLAARMIRVAMDCDT